MKMALDIKFKNYGSTSFEVLDNGSGIAPENYSHIGTRLKHLYATFLHTDGVCDACST
jgi:hypothetical protein